MSTVEFVKAAVLENTCIQVTVDPDTAMFEVMEKESGGVWRMDPWHNSVGELVLRQKDYNFSASKVENFDTTTLNQKRVDASQKIAIDLSESSGIKITEIPNGLQVRLSGSKSEAGEIPWSLVFELIIPDENDSQLVIKVTDLTFDKPGYEMKELHFPARAFYLRTAEDHGYLAIPHDQGALIPVGQEIQTPEQIIPSPCHGPYELPFTRDMTFGSDPLSMSWFGMVREDSSVMAIINTPADASARLVANDKPDASLTRLGSMSPVWRSEKGELGYTRTITYRFEAGGDYVKMTKRYRQHLIDDGKFVSYKEKLRRNPNLERLFGAPVVEFNILTNVEDDKEFAPRLMGYKELWYTFERIEQIIRDMHDNLGIKKAVIIAVGWGREGTDHGYPDLWPPNEEAGGLEALKKLSETAHELGYLFSLHDCYYFTSEGSPSFDVDRDAMTVVNADTQCYPWDGGRCYEVCPSIRMKFTRRNLDIYKKELPLLTAHFTDCVSGSPLFECYHPDHPVTRTEDMRMKEEFMKFIAEEKGLLMGSEDPIDYLAQYCSWFNAAMEGGVEYGLLQGIRTPLWDLVFKDSVRSCWKEGDTYNIAGFAEYYHYTQKALFDLMSANASHWMFIAGAYDYWRDDMREMYQLLSPLAEALAFQEMTEHEFVTEDYFVQRSKFANGTEIFVNMRDKDYEANGLKIAARGFCVKDSPVGDMEGQFKSPALRVTKR